MNRRFFLLAAPAIVAAPSLMKVSALVMPALVDLPVAAPGVTTISELSRLLITLCDEQDRALAELCGIPNILRGAQSA